MVFFYFAGIFIQ